MVGHEFETLFALLVLLNVVLIASGSALTLALGFFRRRAFEKKIQEIMAEDDGTV